jgi:hypothetical protein
MGDAARAAKRGINFALIFPGKKKYDEGNNEDFNNRAVAFNRDEHGISRWVVGPISSKEEVRMLNEIYQEQAGSTTIAYEAALGSCPHWGDGSKHNSRQSYKILGLSSRSRS